MKRSLFEDEGDVVEEMDVTCPKCDFSFVVVEASDPDEPDEADFMALVEQDIVARSGFGDGSNP